MKRQLAISAFLCLATAAVHAADDNRALAKKFVSLMRYDDQFASYRAQCAATYKAISPESLVAQNPDYFGGIRPGHSKWRRVVAAYESYYEEACSRPSKEEFVAVLASSYASSLTARELRSALQFYATPTGKALVSAHAKATSALYGAWTNINREHLVEVSARFQSEIVRLAGSK